MDQRIEKAITDLQAGNITDFKSSVEEVLQDRAVDHINTKRVEVGQAMFSDQSED